MVQKIDSNITGLAFAEEQTLGVLPATPVWRTLEPNTYSDFGGDSPMVARSPINSGRQRQKGATVGLNAGAGFNHDFLLTALNRLLRSFFFAAYHEKADTAPIDGTSVAVSAVSATAATIAAGPTFVATALVLGSGFAVAANNGLHALTAATATSLTGGGFAVEAAPPAAARLQTVGVRGASADLAITVAGGIPSLTSTALNFTTLGLSPGEWVYLGDDAVGNRFANNVGFARVKSIATGALVFDLTTWAPQAEVGTGKTISVFFGKFLRNEKTPSLIVQKPVQFERQLGVNDAVGALQQAEYIVGCLGNELTLNMPQEDKLNIDLSFVGLKTLERDSLAGPLPGTRIAAVDEDAVNTSLDMVRAQLYLLSAAGASSQPSGLFGYIEQASLNISNGLTVNKALGKLGGFDISASDFVAGGSITGYFTSIAAVAAVRQNASVGANMIFAKNNGGCVFDLPALSLGGGRASVEKDQPVTFPVDMSGFESDTYGFTLGYTQFPYLPTLAMPV